MSDSDLFQRLSLDETIRRTFAVYAEGISIFTRIALLTVAIRSIVWAMSLLILLPAFNVVGKDFADPNYLLQHAGAYYGLVGINSMIAMVISAIGNVAMIRVVADLYLKRQPTIEVCIQEGIKKSCTVMAASFLAFWGICLASLFFLVPGIYLSVKWFLVTPIIVVEGLGIHVSFRRSSDLVSGSWCYVFCTFMIAYFVMVFLQFVWSAMFAGGNDVSHTLFSFFGSIVASIPGIIFEPVFAILMTIMYFNLRIEKEGLNSDLLAKNLGEQANGEVDASYSPLVSDEQLDVSDV